MRAEAIAIHPAPAFVGAQHELDRSVAAGTVDRLRHPSAVASEDTAKRLAGSDPKLLERR
jgi:hypothetical protein